MSLALLSVACLPAAMAAVLEMPIRIQDGYSMVEVQVGTPPVSHSLLFDTGSATTWMFTSECVAAGGCNNVSKYNRTNYDSASSSTAVDTGVYGSIEYLGGVTAGDAFTDAFTLSSAPNTTWTQSFLAANESSWTNIPSDGFLGMAFNTISDANTTTLVETLMQDGLLDEPRFGLYYGTEVEDTNGTTGTGTITLGGSHEDVYVDGDMVWAPLSSPGDTAQLWRVSMDYAVGTHPDNSTTGSAKTTVTLSGTWGVFDTGAGRISVPDWYVEDIYASIGMNWSAILAGDVIPLCEDFTDAWSIELNFGDAYNPTTITLKGSELKRPGFATGEDKYCWPPFDNSGVGGLFLFGNDFLQKYYTVFDYGGSTPVEYNARIGFGKLKEEYKPT